MHVCVRLGLKPLVDWDNILSDQDVSFFLVYSSIIKQEPRFLSY